MARIRSIHPGLYTDEAYVSVSMAARVLLPGVWTECDDHGVFEWKPLTLKMKIFPADSADVATLLVELSNAGIVQKFTHDGKEFGAVRNFCAYQRPKKPAYRHPLPDELRTYVAYKEPSSEPVGGQFGTGGEIPPQMEDGEKEEGGEKKKDSELRSGDQPKKSRRKASVPLPEGWRPSSDGLDHAKKIGLTNRETELQINKFINHAREKDRRCADWDAAWRNWCLNALEFSGRSPPPAEGEPQQIFVPIESPRWGGLVAKWREQQRKNTGPPPYEHKGIPGWWFPIEWTQAA
jgi:hypothetical protein